MIDLSQIKFFDGDYEILYSGDFNIYENKLVIDKIAGFSFEFLFTKDSNINGQLPIKIEGDGINKIVKISLVNFDNTLGAGTTKKIPIINTIDSKQIFFSIHAKSLDASSTFLKVSVTFYIK
ncbi:MAG: hypothetical protein L7H18_04895 [Candidatus Nealsonbacteria bacterium DGGOD1a]|jgi:hypothetical protein|nr:MAG: hypothetical protein L7H18_04895 [Candidatus Nealsonbacteria bacterium DGGOD1a]